MNCQELFIGSPILIHGQDFLANLYKFELMEFDVILGMDWLSKHRVHVDCLKQKMTLRGLTRKEIVHRGKPGASGVGLISAITAQKLHGRGCEGYLCNVVQTETPKRPLESIPIVQEFPNVFSKEISGIPPPQEVAFCIDLISGSTPSLGPYIEWRQWNLRS